jgi:hypothetical protein
MRRLWLDVRDSTIPRVFIVGTSPVAWYVNPRKFIFEEPLKMSRHNVDIIGTDLLLPSGIKL